MDTCDACKSRPGVRLIRPWNNPNYHPLSLCQECIDNKVIYRTT